MDGKGPKEGDEADGAAATAAPREDGGRKTEGAAAEPAPPVAAGAETGARPGRGATEPGGLVEELRVLLAKQQRPE